MAGSFVRELKRRKVFRVAVIYIASAWVLMQVGDVMFAALHLPEWSITMLVAFLILGFPPTVIFAWAYELTPAADANGGREKCGYQIERRRSRLWKSRAGKMHEKRFATVDERPA